MKFSPCYFECPPVAAWWGLAAGTARCCARQWPWPAWTTRAGGGGASNSEGCPPSLPLPLRPPLLPSSRRRRESGRRRNVPCWLPTLLTRLEGSQEGGDKDVRGQEIRNPARGGFLPSWARTFAASRDKMQVFVQHANLREVFFAGQKHDTLHRLHGQKNTMMKLQLNHIFLNKKDLQNFTS